MKWLDLWLYKKWKIFQSFDSEPELEEPWGLAKQKSLGRLSGSFANSVKVRTTNSVSPDSYRINFSLYPATGGNILEIRFYDKKTDNEITNLHIIHSDQDLGDAIGKIITYEMLKQ